MTTAMNTGERTGTGEFRQDVKRVGDDLGHVKDALVGTAHDVAHAARSGVADARQAVSRTMDSAVDSGRYAAKTVTDQIQENPLAAIGIAVGVGVLIGMSLCRKG